MLPVNLNKINRILYFVPICVYTIFSSSQRFTLYTYCNSQVKDEPADAGYDEPAPVAQSGNHSSSNSRASSPPLSIPRDATSPCPDADESSMSQSEDQQPVDDGQTSSSIRPSQSQGTNSSKKNDSVQNIVEGLLKKNASLLAKRESESLKTKSIKRIHDNGISKVEPIPEVHKVDPIPDVHKVDPIPDMVFPVSMVSQARLVSSRGNRGRMNDSKRGQFLRPKSPTRKCHFSLRDDSHLSYAVMESNVGDPEMEKLFRVQNHELVCAVSLKSYVTDNQKKVVAVLDNSYYWCNFCSYTSNNKESLSQHIMDHRFQCNHCLYESFCRSDVLRHMAATHSELLSSENSLSYCTFLSDYLRVKSRAEKLAKNMPCASPDDDTDDLDRDKMQAELLKAEKRKQEDIEDMDESQGKRARFDDDAKGQESFERSGKSRKSLKPRRHPQPSESDYDTFEMEVEEISDYVENGSNEHLIDRSRVVYPSSVSGDSSDQVTMMSRMQLIPTLHDGGKQSFTATHIPAASPIHSGPGRPPKNSCPMNKSKRSGTSSSLYWSCGYCDFQSNSQAEIKEHSNRNHPGNPHRYVALIKNMNPDSIINKKVGKNTASNYRSHLSGSNQGRTNQGTFSSVKLDSVSGNKANSSSSISDKVVSLKEDSDPSNLLKVKFNPLKSKPKETTIYRCYHCPYTARRHSAMKSHIYYRHRGKGLLAVDDESNTGEKVFFCARDDCTFKSMSPIIYLNHVEQCTPWHKPELADVEVEPHIRECLHQTVTFAELAREKVAM